MQPGAAGTYRPRTISIPSPSTSRARILTTAINEEDATASLDLAFQVAPYFELRDLEARKIAADVARGVTNWRREAARHGLSKAEIDRMASAFDHEDREKAIR